MKLTRFAFAAALCGGLFATSVDAQERWQASQVQPAALTYNYYAQDSVTPSPSDLAPNDIMLTAGSESVQKDGHAKGSKGSKGCKGCRSCCEPWRLFPEIGNGWQLTGHLAAGATANADHPVSRYNGPVTFNDRDREVQFNQAYLSLGREADNGGCGWAWGARMDLLYGTDYIFTQAVGLELDDMGNSQWNGHRHYGLAMPQAYVDVAYNDLSLRIGHFYTIMGYEVVPATGNFFYSHAYTMQYGEPFTHSGGLFTYNYSDQVTLYGGLVNGWDALDQETDKLAFLGGATYAPCHERYSITGTFISGDQDGFNVGNPVTPRHGYSLVFNYNVTDNLEYVLQHDNFWWEDQFGPGVDAEWYGVNQYLFYTINDCWKLGARLEWFRDDDGVRLSGTHLRETLFGRAGVPQMAGAQAAGDYYNLTLGANWTPRTNLTLRPEVRWDWSDGTGGGAGMGLPFDGGTKDSQFTAAFDAILVF